MSNIFIEDITWSEGRTKKELAKQTTWSSSKDFCGLSGIEVKCYNFNNHVNCTAFTSHGLSFHKYFQIPIDKVEEFCNTLMKAKKLMENDNEKV